MNSVERLVWLIDSMNKSVGHFVSWITTLMVAVVFIDVFMRYVFNISFVLMQELEWHLFGFIFLIGAGYALLHDAHVRVDILYQKLGAKGRAWIDFLGCLFFLFPSCYMVIYTSMNFVGKAFRSLEGSPDPGGIPYRFVILSCMPVGFFLLSLQGLSLFIKSFQVIIGFKKPESAERGVVDA
jgi:TRAP-type mannitol/chloroaromatic compound transport system permease small subunit